jgi:hypothetical protein
MKSDAIPKTAAGYFPRYLCFSDDNGQAHHVDENEMLAKRGPKVVLGEPGMGKSELMNEVGRRLKVAPVSAVRFMSSMDPVKFVLPGRPLLVDGLDEAMARREGDAVDAVMAKLEEAGSPEFILSCRSREWQARSATSLRQIYGADPVIFTLEPLSRTEAGAFLTERFPQVEKNLILDHLDKHSLAELYGNPLTLRLMGQVAEHDAHLPSTRAALFERVCTLIWSEHDPERQDGGLGKVSEERALLAAGAIMAGLLFAGAEAVSEAGPAQLQSGDIRLADLEALPGASAARAIFSSKLFYGAGIARAKPLHKVIAEYLGARWLAQHVAEPRAQRRLLAQLSGSGGVPASLRGIHAWLAFHSPAMAERVIAADPFGVLRYGDVAELSAAQADCMLDSLCALAEIDPYFRTQDWDSRTVTGLMIPQLSGKIGSIIESTESNEHLRSLLVEGLKGTALSMELGDTLEAVMMSNERFYREREGAADALFPHRSKTWWRQAIARLREEGTENATRLARNLIEDMGCDVDDELLVATIFAEMGVTICPLPQVKKNRTHMVRYYARTVDSLPAARLVGVLNLLSDFASLLKGSDWENKDDLEGIVCDLVVRAIDESVVGSADAGMLWRWLETLQDSEHRRRSKQENLRIRLEEHDVLRRAIQQHALYVARPRATVWMTEIDLGRRMVGLTRRPKDVIWFLERMSNADKRDPAQRQDWCDLVSIGFGHGMDVDVRRAGEKFQHGDADLEAFVYELEHPETPEWQRERERKAAKRQENERAAKEIHRRRFMAHRTDLRAGELGTILSPAKAYLGLFSDITRDQPAADRVAEWLGPDLRDDTMAGIEAVLHRADLPTPQDVANGFANHVTWNYCFPVMAGLLARQRSGKGFSGLTPEVLTVGLLLCHGNSGISIDDDLSTLCEALEAIVIPTAKDREDFARLWIEPALAARCTHVSGLYLLAHDEEWQSTGAKLAGNWLTAYPNLPDTIELELVDCLAHSGALATLASIAAARADTVFRDFDHMLGWLAIDVIVRFDAVLPHITGIGSENPHFIWFLRNRLALERRGKMLPISARQAKWIISEFRREWPYATLSDGGSDDSYPYDATDFIRSLIDRLANDTGLEASEAMQVLIEGPPDSYSELIRHMAAEQRQKRAEKLFAPLSPKGLGELLSDGPPSNIDDLKSLVLEELAIAQRKLIGDDLDEVSVFWNDSGVPYDENRCRDRLAAMIGPELSRYEVQRITEVDMPKSKRADLAFACGRLQLPMEIKGQWHNDVWDAATSQLDVQYLVDWRSEQRGIYCVLWFGNLAFKSGRRLRSPPRGLKAPKTAKEMQEMLVQRIPEARRALIDVVVIDLVTGRR